MTSEPDCKWNCIAGVLVNEQGETALCPFHDGVLVNGRPTRIHYSEKRPCDNCGHVHLPGHTWTAQAPGVCLPNEWTDEDHDVPTIPKISVRNPEEDDVEWNSDGDWIHPEDRVNGYPGEYKK